MTCNGAPALNISEKAVFDNLTNNINWGMMIGNPRIAIKDACCIALEAIAANIVNTRLNPIEPRRLIPTNAKNEVVGSPKNAVYKIRLMIFMMPINKILYTIFESIKADGVVIEKW